MSVDISDKKPDFSFLMALPTLHGTAFGKEVDYIINLKLYVDEDGNLLDRYGRIIRDHRRREWKLIKAARKDFYEHLAFREELGKRYYAECELRRKIERENLK